MAKKDLTFKLTIEYDPEENRGIPPRVFLFQLINRLGYKHKIKNVEYGGKTRTFRADTQNKVRDLPLRKVDSIDEADLPPRPDLSNVTKLDPSVRGKKTNPIPARG